MKERKSRRAERGGKRVPGLLPRGQSREQEARFWEDHDFAEFWAQTEGVDVEVARSFAQQVRSAARKRLVALRLAEWQIDEAKRLAKKLGLPYQTLLRRWISQGILTQRRGLKRAH
ncbi:MAG TPA: CopG family antitoxin [Planctomycetota bacterium]|nr:CopG family antitoxin [Planctomycetota bacterium]